MNTYAHVFWKNHCTHLTIFVADIIISFFMVENFVTCYKAGADGNYFFEKEITHFFETQLYLHQL